MSWGPPSQWHLPLVWSWRHWAMGPRPQGDQHLWVQQPHPGRVWRTPASLPRSTRPISRTLGMPDQAAPPALLGALAPHGPDPRETTYPCIQKRGQAWSLWVAQWITASFLLWFSWWAGSSWWWLRTPSPERLASTQTRCQRGRWNGWRCTMHAWARTWTSASLRAWGCSRWAACSCPCCWWFPCARASCTAGPPSSRAGAPGRPTALSTCAWDSSMGTGARPWWRTKSSRSQKPATPSRGLK